MKNGWFILALVMALALAGVVLLVVWRKQNGDAPWLNQNLDATLTISKGGALPSLF